MSVVIIAEAIDSNAVGGMQSEAVNRQAIDRMRCIGVQLKSEHVILRRLPGQLRDVEKGYSG